MNASHTLYQVVGRICVKHDDDGSCHIGWMQDITVDTDLEPTLGLPAGDLDTDALLVAQEKQDQADYHAYHLECEDENLESHTMRMWKIHGRPGGPI